MRRIVLIHSVFLLTSLVLLALLGIMIPKEVRQWWDGVVGVLGGLLSGIAILFGTDYWQNRHHKQGAPFRSLMILATASALAGFTIVLSSAFDLFYAPNTPNSWFFLPVVAFWIWIATCHWFFTFGVKR